jgi:hypothetical protein
MVYTWSLSYEIYILFYFPERGIQTYTYIKIFRKTNIGMYYK